MISDGSACRLRSFIKKNRSGLTKVDELNATPLHHAAEGGQIELMQLIIDDSSSEGNTYQLFIQHSLKNQSVSNLAEAGLICVMFLRSKRVQAVTFHSVLGMTWVTLIVLLVFDLHCSDLMHLTLFGTQIYSLQIWKNCNAPTVSLSIFFIWIICLSFYI